MAKSFQESFNSKWNVLLGSKSPRRRELLSHIGFDFTLVGITCDEDFPSSLTSKDIAEFLAKSKSEHYLEPLKENDLLLTADTIVWHESEVLNKPLNRAEAAAMLRKLQNSFHEVITGVHLRSKHAESSFTETTKVHFQALSEHLIQEYVNTDSPLDKAGGYGIQDPFGKIAVDRIEGCYNNVVGLPSTRLYMELSNFDSEQS